MLSVLLLNFLYGMVLNVGRMSAGGISGYGDVLMLILFLVLALAMATVPTIMLYSLITKRLYGFAASVWLLVAIAVFYLLVTLPSRVGLFEWLSDMPVPVGLKALLGVAGSIGWLFLPFVVFSRMMRLVDKWLYPKVFKPLEGRM